MDFRTGREEGGGGGGGGSPIEIFSKYWTGTYGLSFSRNMLLHKPPDGDPFLQELHVFGLAAWARTVYNFMHARRKQALTQGKIFVYKHCFC